MKKIDKRIVVLVIIVIVWPLIYTLFHSTGYSEQTVDICGNIYHEPSFGIRYSKALCLSFQFLLPMGLIAIGIFDCIVAHLKDNKKLLKECIEKLVIKIFVCVILFFVILLLNIVLDYISDDGIMCNEIEGEINEKDR